MPKPSRETTYPKIIPGSEPFYFPGGRTGCLLLHGFSATPEEMRPLGEFLAGKGYTVISVRLAGHGTHPADLKRIRWTDWLDDVEGNLDLLSATCTKRVLIGQSMGGMIALVAAARFEVAGVVAISTPYGVSHRDRMLDHLARWLRPTIRKGTERFPANHPMYHCRELYYPAYPEVPARILTELDGLTLELKNTLPQVKVPALVIQSRADMSVPFSCMQSIYDALGSQQKEMLPMEGMNHSIVLDPEREQVFEAIHHYLVKIGG